MVAIFNGGSLLLGLCKDGSVKVAYPDDSAEKEVNNYKQLKTEVEGWKDIVSISSGHSSSQVVGVHRDGTVEVAYPIPPKPPELVQVMDSVRNWRDIVSVQTEYCYVLGLRKDGTVISAKTSGSGTYGELDLSEWKNVTAFLNDWNAYTIGVRDDGFLYYKGVSKLFSHQRFREKLGQVSSAIAVCNLGINRAAVLRMDGTVLQTGDISSGITKLCEETVAIASWGSVFFGLRCDGTLMVIDTKQKLDDECLAELKTWDNIRVLPIRKENILFCSNMQKELKEEKRRQQWLN